MIKVGKKIKPKQSSILLTVNTNKLFTEDDPHLKDDINIFNFCIKQILKNIDKYF